MRRIIAGLVLSIMAGTSWGDTTVAGVEVVDSVVLEDGRQLELNGAGVRTKFFIKVYVGALYLPQRTRSAKEAISMAGPKRVLMHFVYDEVDREKITDGWNDGFEANLSQTEFDAIRERIDRFDSMFEDMRAGDEIVLTYLPDLGTRVEVKNRDKGWIEGQDFARALLRIWLGEDPVNSGLKRAMLGGGD